MIKEEWQQIKENQDVRQNLSRLRQEIKDKDLRRRFSELIRGEEFRLTELLHSEDAKTRKNAALLMGDLGRQEFMAPVFESYRKEEQRFVRSSYLTAMGKFDYEEYVQDLKECLEELQKTEVTAENQKHLAEEMRELSSWSSGRRKFKPIVLPAGTNPLISSCLQTVTLRNIHRRS